MGPNIYIKICENEVSFLGRMVRGYKNEAKVEENKVKVETEEKNGV